MAAKTARFGMIVGILNDYYIYLYIFDILNVWRYSYYGSVVVVAAVDDDDDSD